MQANAFNMTAIVRGEKSSFAFFGITGIYLTRGCWSEESRSRSVARHVKLGVIAPPTVLARHRPTLANPLPRNTTPSRMSTNMRLIWTLIVGLAFAVPVAADETPSLRWAFAAWRGI